MNKEYCCVCNVDKTKSNINDSCITLGGHRWIEE